MKKTGHKIWYVIAIILSCLVLLLSVAGIAGIWITNRAVTNAVGNLVVRVETMTGNLRTTLQGFDQKLANMQAITTNISQSSATLSSQVASQGLINTLLPESQDQNLSQMAASVQESISTVRDVVSTAVAIYNSLDQLPFVNLPGPSQAQVDKLTGTIDTLQTAVDNVKNAITTFRAGAAKTIDQVTTAVNTLTSRLGDARSQLADIDTRLANAQSALERLKQTITNVLLLLSILVTLFLLYVIYTQVEVIRLYVQRWRAAGQTQMSGASPTTQETPSGESNSPAVEDEAVK